MRQEQEQRNLFIVSLSGLNLDITTINIEEMAGYCKQKGRLANIVTEKQTYGELEKINYSLVFNYTRPKPRVVVTKNKPYSHVFNVLSEKYKKGLLIAETDTISDPIAEHLLTNKNWHDNDIDLMVCRHFATVTKGELERADYLRISADPDFDPSLLEKVGEVYGDNTAGIMVAQLFVNDNYENTKRYLEIKTAKCIEEGLTDYIDHYEMNKQLAYFIYYDNASGKIMNVDTESIAKFINKMKQMGLMPFPDDQIQPFAESITL